MRRWANTACNSPCNNYNCTKPEVASQGKYSLQLTLQQLQLYQARGCVAGQIQPATHPATTTTVPSPRLRRWANTACNSPCNNYNCTKPEVASLGKYSLQLTLQQLQLYQARGCVAGQIQPTTHPATTTTVPSPRLRRWANTACNSPCNNYNCTKPEVASLGKYSLQLTLQQLQLYQARGCVAGQIQPATHPATTTTVPSPRLRRWANTAYNSPCNNYNCTKPEVASLGKYSLQLTLQQLQLYQARGCVAGQIQPATHPATTTTVPSPRLRRWANTACNSPCNNYNCTKPEVASLGKYSLQLTLQQLQLYQARGCVAGQIQPATHPATTTTVPSPRLRRWANTACNSPCNNYNCTKPEVASLGKYSLQLTLQQLQLYQARGCVAGQIQPATHPATTTTVPSPRLRRWANTACNSPCNNYNCTKPEVASLGKYSLQLTLQQLQLYQARGCVAGQIQPATHPATTTTVPSPRLRRWANTACNSPCNNYNCTKPEVASLGKYSLQLTLQQLQLYQARGCVAGQIQPATHPATTTTVPSPRLRRWANTACNSPCNNYNCTKPEVASLGKYSLQLTLQQLQLYQARGCVAGQIQPATHPATTTTVPSPRQLTLQQLQLYQARGCVAGQIQPATHPATTTTVPSPRLRRWANTACNSPCNNYNCTKPEVASLGKYSLQLTLQQLQLYQARGCVAGQIQPATHPATTTTVPSPRLRRWANTACNSPCNNYNCTKPEVASLGKYSLQLTLQQLQLYQARGCVAGQIQPATHPATTTTVPSPRLRRWANTACNSPCNNYNCTKPEVASLGKYSLQLTLQQLQLYQARGCVAGQIQPATNPATTRTVPSPRLRRWANTACN